MSVCCVASCSTVSRPIISRSVKKSAPHAWRRHATSPVNNYGSIFNIDKKARFNIELHEDIANRALLSSRGIDEFARTRAEAWRLIKAWEVLRPQTSVYLRLHAESEKGNQLLRTSIAWPVNPELEGSTPVVYFFSTSEQERILALNAGAKEAGDEEMMEKLMSGELPVPDSLLTTSASLRSITSNRTLVPFLGKLNLVPSVRRGTVVDNIEQAVKDNLGKLEVISDGDGVFLVKVARAEFTFEEVNKNLEYMKKAVAEIPFLIVEEDLLDKSGKKERGIKHAKLRTVSDSGNEISQEVGVDLWGFDVDLADYGGEEWQAAEAVRQAAEEKKKAENQSKKKGKRHSWKVWDKGREAPGVIGQFGKWNNKEDVVVGEQA